MAVVEARGGRSWPRLVAFSSPLCTASSGAMVLWCHTVMSSVQGRTISTIARMSRRFGISKAEGTHSSSLPDSENPRDRTAEDMENRDKWTRRNNGREREREERAAEGGTARRSYQYSQPTHCTSRFAGTAAARGGGGGGRTGRCKRGTFLQAILREPPARRTSGSRLDRGLQGKAERKRQKEALEGWAGSTFRLLKPAS